MSHDIHEETTYERAKRDFEREWDETEIVVKKFYFGDRVITPKGEEGTVTEIDGDSDIKYRVDGVVHVGWFSPEELTKVK